ncbi:MAG: hypothetical protein AAF399_03065 [Bacteroidota bacterium]
MGRSSSPKRSTRKSKRIVQRKRAPFFDKNGQEPFFAKTGSHEVVPKVQTFLERDPATGRPTGNYQFQVGAGLSASFLAQVKRLVADGSLTNDEIEQMRIHAIRQRGTMTQSERLLLAGLLNPANVPILQAHRSGSFAFPLASITRANRTQVANVGRESVPPAIIHLLNQGVAAVFQGDWATTLQLFALAHQMVVTQILQAVGPGYQTKGAHLIAFAEAHNLMLTEVLAAMLNAASDSSHGDQLLAGITYATAAQAGHPAAARLRSGQIHVDALIDRAFVQLSGNQIADAFYVSVPLNDRTKADTLYLRTSTDVRNVAHRALIIHELTHAEEDANASTQGQRVPQLAFEARAFRAQVRYMMDQILATPVAERPPLVTQAAQSIGLHGLFQWAAVLEAKQNLTRYQTLATTLLQTPPNAVATADLANAFAMTNAALQTRLQQVIALLPIYAAGNQAILDGAQAETIVDHFN